MEQNESKTARQKLGILKWIANNCVGMFQWFTGVGKTFAAIMAIKETQPSSIIVVVPTINLQDQWEAQLKENGIVNYVVYVVNTACKLHLLCDMLIIDEAHVLGAPTFREVLNNIKYTKLLALSATPKRQDGEHEFLLERCPIVDTITEKEAIENSWVSSYDQYVYVVEFTPEEAAAYEKADTKVRYCMANYGITGSYKAITARKNLCYNAFNKLQVSHDILEHFKDRKALVFSKSTEFAEKLQYIVGDECTTYHSKLPKKEQKLRLEQFRTGEKRVISSVTALNAGTDVPDCSLGLIASGDSTMLTKNQQRGRILRYVDGKKAIIIHLCVKNSVEVSWINRKLYGQHNVKWINSLKQIE